MKILIAIPAYGKLDFAFVQSLLALNKVGTCGILMIANTLISEARNDFVNKALENDYDYVFFMDSDMTFPMDALETLLEDDVDIVSGLYFKRVPPYSPIMYKKYKLLDNGGVLDWEDYSDGYPENQLFECGCVGGGCLLIKTSVFKDLIEHGYNHPFNHIASIGEDFSFCIRAAQCGYKIYCDSRVKCGHIGSFVVTEENRLDLEKVFKK